MRLYHVFLLAILAGVLMTTALAQAPRPASASGVKPAIAVAHRPAGASGAPRPAGGSGARTVARTAPKPAPQKEMTDEEKTIYAIGLMMSRSLKQFALSPAETEIIKRALTDAAAGKPAIELDPLLPKIGELTAARGLILLAREKEASAAYVAKAAAEPGAIKTTSGLVYKELTPGTGASPSATDTVKVNYRGTLIDGTEFDSSYKRNQPAQFPLSGVIKGWTEGVQLMKVGGKTRFICPSDLAYGDAGRPPTIPGGAALIFEIELLEIPGK
jgi:FKBP-type peptidyl-prolyl cis-trans isomerase FkpA